MEKTEKRIDYKQILARGKKIAIFILILLAGYGACELRYYINRPVQITVIPELPKTKKLQKTSVSINERGELLIIDRNTGEYEIFEDSIGLSIFVLYSKEIEAEYESK